MMDGENKRGFSLAGEGTVNPFTSMDDLYFFFTTYIAEEYYIASSSSSGSNKIYCGQETFKCSSVDKVINRAFINAAKSFKLDSGIHTQTPFIINTNEYKYIGNTDTPSSLSSNTPSTLFAIFAGSLSLTSIILSSSHSTTLITLESGTLNITHCTVKAESGSSTFSSSLIGLSGGVTTIQTSTLSGVSVNTGNGGGVRGTLGEGESLEVSGGSVSVCGVLDGDGGGVWVRKSGSGKVNISSESFSSCSCNTGGDPVSRGGAIYLSLVDSSASFVLSSLSFSSNNADEGKDIFLSTTDLSLVVSPSTFPFYETIGDRERGLMGMDEHLFPTPITLFIFLPHYSSSVVYAREEDGYDTVFCGMLHVPCSTISLSVSHFSPDTSSTLILFSPFSLNLPITL
jgi:hypothetical protein